MGTDMHIMVEVNRNGEGWRPYSTTPLAMKTPRHYPLFSVLADVRNLAGRHEKVWQDEHEHELESGEKITVPGYWYDVEDGGHERLTPISEPRGIPDDASPEWRANVLVWQMKSNCVDVTWVTPSEILAADWDQVLIRYGVVSEAEYIELTETGKPPHTHAADAGGPGMTIVSEEEYAEGKRGEDTTMVRAVWSEGPLRNAIQGSFFRMVKEIQEQETDSTKVRFMLLFES